MKICANCKASCDDSSNFCQNCSSNSFEQNPQSSQQNNFRQESIAFNPAVAAVKSLGSGNLFLAAVILFTIFAVCAFLSYSYNAASDSYTLGYLEEFKKGFESNNSFHLNTDNLSAAIQNYNISNILLLGIPNILICIGLWKLRKTFTSTQNGGLNIKAFRFLKIMLIIGLITTILSEVTRGIFMSNIVQNVEFDTNIFFDFPDYDKAIDYDDIIDINKGVRSALTSGIIFAILIAITFASIYYAKILSTFNSVKNIVSTGVASDYISMFVVVMNYVYAFFSLFALSESALSFIGNGAYIAFLIIMSILLIRYRDDMRVAIYRHNYNFAEPSNYSGFSAGIQ